MVTLNILAYKFVFFAFNGGIKLRMSKRMLLFFILTVFTVVSSQNISQPTAEYYLNWITRRSQEILQYELPTDARMHEAEDTTLRGKNIIEFLTLFRLMHNIE